jgi:hypothetical protein
MPNMLVNCDKFLNSSHTQSANKSVFFDGFCVNKIVGEILESFGKMFQ